MLNQITIPTGYGPVNTSDTPDTQQSIAAARQDSTNAIIKLVDFAVGRLARRYGLQEADIQDLRQAGYIAGLSAYTRYKPSSGALSTWILRRVNGELIDQLKGLRNGGLTGHGSHEALISPSDTAYGLDDAEVSDVPGTAAPDVVSLLDSIPDERSISPELGASMGEILGLAQDKLNPTDYAILLAYHGVGQKPKTIRELASTYGISATRIHYRLTRAHECLGRLAMGNTDSIAGRPEQSTDSGG